MWIRTLSRNSQILSNQLYYVFIDFYIMNIYLFWILFLALWAIVPLMIIKGKVDESPKLQVSPEIKAKKKGWFK